LAATQSAGKSDEQIRSVEHIKATRFTREDGMRLENTIQGHYGSLPRRVDKLEAQVNETLELLQRDARQLERALQDAGLNTSEENMKFSLKDQSLAHGGKDHAEGDEDFASMTENDGTDLPSVSNDPMPPPVRYMATSGLDIHI